MAFRRWILSDWFIDIYTNIFIVWGESLFQRWIFLILAVLFFLIEDIWKKRLIVYLTVLVVGVVFHKFLLYKWGKIKRFIVGLILDFGDGSFLLVVFRVLRSCEWGEGFFLGILCWLGIQMYGWCIEYDDECWLVTTYEGIWINIWDFS